MPSLICRCPFTYWIGLGLLTEVERQWKRLQASQRVRTFRQLLNLKEPRINSTNFAETMVSFGLVNFNYFPISRSLEHLSRLTILTRANALSDIT